MGTAGRSSEVGPDSGPSDRTRIVACCTEQIRKIFAATELLMLASSVMWIGKVVSGVTFVVALQQTTVQLVSEVGGWQDTLIAEELLPTRIGREETDDLGLDREIVDRCLATEVLAYSEMASRETLGRDCKQKRECSYIATAVAVAAAAAVAVRLLYPVES